MLVPALSIQKALLVPILPVILIYAVILFTTLPQHDLWGDEIYTLKTVKLDWGPLVTQRASAGHPPLFFILLCGFCQRFLG
jgi:hypothetical protein